MVKVDNLFPVRSEVSNEDASQFFVNPCTGQHSVMGNGTPCKIACLHSMIVRVLLNPCNSGVTSDRVLSSVWRAVVGMVHELQPPAGSW